MKYLFLGWFGLFIMATPMKSFATSCPHVLGNVQVKKYVPILKSGQTELAAKWIGDFKAGLEPRLGVTYANRMLLLLLESGAVQVKFLNDQPTDEVRIYGQGKSYDLSQLIARIVLINRAYMINQKNASEVQMINYLLDQRALSLREPRSESGSEEDDDDDELEED